MKRSTVCIQTSCKSGFECGVVLDGQPCVTPADEADSRIQMQIVKVEPRFYIDFVRQLVDAGWFMSEGAKLNFDHQVNTLDRYW